MAEIRLTTWDVWNPLQNGKNYQPQLVQDFSHQQYVNFRVFYTDWFHRIAEDMKLPQHKTPQSYPVLCFQGKLVLPGAENGS